MMNLQDFKSKIQKLNSRRKTNITGCLGVYDVYKWVRKNKWFNIGHVIHEHQFYGTIRTMNNLLVEELLKGNDIKLPHRLGTIEIRKNPVVMSIVDGKVKANLPIDWDKTLKLWYEDKESFETKTLIKQEENEIFRIVYNRTNADYNNKSFYKFTINRDLKRRLKQKIKEGELDAFTS